MLYSNRRRLGAVRAFKLQGLEVVSQQANVGRLKELLVTVA